MSFLRNFLSIVTILSALSLWSCESEQGPEPVDCSTSDLAVAALEVNDASGCTTTDGSVIFIASGGTSPYKFSINGGDLQSSATFENLGPGNYSVAIVDDNECEATNQFQILAGTGTLAFSGNPTVTDSGCGTENSTITVTANGAGTIQYKLDDTDYTTSNTFENIAPGDHVITITDDSGCTSTAEVKVTTGVSYINDIHPIIVENCTIAGCHDGSNGADRNWTIFSNVQAKAQGIKTRTGNGSMPRASSGKTLTQQEIDLIACWVDDGALDN